MDGDTARRLARLALRLDLNSGDDTNHVEIDSDDDQDDAMPCYWETVASEVLPDGHPILEKDKLTYEDFVEINNEVRCSSPDAPNIYMGTDPLEYYSDVESDASELEPKQDDIDLKNRMLEDFDEESDDEVPDIDEGCFAMLVKEISQDYNLDVNFDAGALAALQSSTEDYIVEWLLNIRDSAKRGNVC